MNNSFKLLVAVMLMTMTFITTSCSGGEPAAENTTETPSETAVEISIDETPSADTAGQIYLYGEAHGVDEIIEKEFELWYDYYHNQGMRHLFVEGGHGAKELLNVWMKSDSDELLDLHFASLSGGVIGNSAKYEFYKQIKAECPETVFHGTDIEHQADTTGQRYLYYLRENGMRDSDEYRLELQMLDDRDEFYSGNDEAFREDKLTEYFMREFDALDGESVMGIFGAQHTAFGGTAFDLPDKPNMATMLRDVYGDAVHSGDLTVIRTDKLTVGGKEYTASYFGADAGYSGTYASREFWRLEDAYDDFKDSPQTGDVLPYNEYPTSITEGQVFVIDYTTASGNIERKYYISDGTVWETLPSTVEIEIAEPVGQ